MTEERKSVSVIIPTYNRGHLLRPTICSVADQLTTNDELIVVDDGSQDDTSKVLQQLCSEYKDQTQIIYIPTENGGVSRARNIGIDRASCHFVAFCDSDTHFLPGTLETQLRVFERFDEAILCFTNWCTTRTDGEKYGNGLSFWTRNDTAWSDQLEESEWQFIDPSGDHQELDVRVGSLYSTLVRGNYVPVWTTIVRRDRLMATDRFAEGLNCYEDWQFISQLCQRAPVVFVDIESTHNISHPGPRLTGIDRCRKLEIQLEIMDRVWGSDELFLRSSKQQYLKQLRQKQVSLLNAYLASSERKNAMQLFRANWRNMGGVTGASFLAKWLIGSLIPRKG